MQPTCGSANGSATAVVTGGVGPFSYLWFPSFQTTQTATGLLFGGYQVTVTDESDGHTASAFATVSNLGAPAIVFISSDNVSCNAGSDGAATALATGGTAPYTYRWTYNAAPYPGFSRFLSGARAGTYTLEATDANGCVATGNVVITEPPALALTFSTTPATTSLHCDGSATAAVSGGTPGYGYSWSPSGGTGATAAGLCPGLYSTTASDANGCSIMRFTFVGALAIQPHTVTTSVTHSTCGAGNGTATANVSDGAGPFTYAWSPGGQTTQTATNLAAGTYTVVVTDTTTALQDTATATITDPGGPTVSVASNTPVSCNGGSDGSASVAAAGGSSPYTYLWSDGSALSARTGLAAGAYGIQVTDANGCAASTSTTITQPPALAVAIGTTPASSSLACDGGATATASGGVGGYSYQWAPSGGAASSMSGACPGNYTVTVTDANSCMTSVPASIGSVPSADLRVTQPDPPAGFVGSDVAYAITLANDGPDDASTVSLTDAVPAGTTFVSLLQASGPLFTCTTPPAGGTGLVTCTRATLAGGASAVFELVVRSNPGLPGATIVNTATAASATADPDPADNAATANATLTLRTDVAIALAAPASAAPGAAIAYDIELSVPGTANAQDVQWSLPLPAGAAFTSLSSPAGWTCAAPAIGGTGTATCGIATLPAGSTASFVVTVGTSTALAGATLAPIATVSTTTPEVANPNNVATASTSLGALADLAVSKMLVGPLVAGRDATYSIAVSNAGPNDATAVALSDGLPAQLAFVSLTAPAGFTCTTPAIGSGGTVSCGAPAMASGASGLFTLVARVHATVAAGTSVSNTASVTAATADPAPGNNTASASSTAATRTFSGPSATGTGIVTASFTGGGAACSFANPQFIPVTGHPRSPPNAPAAIAFPHGLFDFTTTGCTPGSTITMTVTYPSALTPGSRYWKYGPTPTRAAPHWYVLPAAVGGNTATFDITDGALGDDDLAANGTIVDQGGPGVGGAAAIATPTLSEWLLAALALLILAVGARYQGRSSRG